MTTHHTTLPRVPAPVWLQPAGAAALLLAALAVPAPAAWLLAAGGIVLAALTVRDALHRTRRIAALDHALADRDAALAEARDSRAGALHRLDDRRRHYLRGVATAAAADVQVLLFDERRAAVPAASWPVVTDDVDAGLLERAWRTGWAATSTGATSAVARRLDDARTHAGIAVVVLTASAPQAVVRRALERAEGSRDWQRLATLTESAFLVHAGLEA